MVETTPFKMFEPFEMKNGVPRQRSLRFDINALADFEQETGMGFGQLMQMKAVFATSRALLWAGLKHEDRTLSVEYVGHMIGQLIKTGTGIDEVMEAAFTAADEQGAFGDPAARKKNKEKKGLLLKSKKSAPAVSGDDENPTTATGDES